MNEELKNNFKKYVYDNFDMNEASIKRKFYHSFRVMELSKLIAKYIGFNDNDAEIASVVGLLHDIGRFEQWKNYHTFSDIKSIDHGQLGIKILFEDKFINKWYKENDNYDEIYDAIKYHNKLIIKEDISKHNYKLCQVIRDADKLDILYLVTIKSIKINECNLPITKKVNDTFFNHKTIDSKDIENDNDRIIAKLALIFDLNFKISFDYLKQYKIIDKLYELVDNKPLFKDYFVFAKNFVNEVDIKPQN